MFADNSVHKANYSIGNIDGYDSIFHAYASRKMSRWRCGVLTYSQKKPPCLSCSEGIHIADQQMDMVMRQKIYQQYVLTPKYLEILRAKLFG